METCKQHSTDWSGKAKDLGFFLASNIHIMSPPSEFALSLLWGLSSSLCHLVLDVSPNIPETQIIKWMWSPAQISCSLGNFMRTARVHIEISGLWCRLGKSEHSLRSLETWGDAWEITGVFFSGNQRIMDKIHVFLKKLKCCRSTQWETPQITSTWRCMF